MVGRRAYLLLGERWMVSIAGEERVFRWQRAYRHLSPPSPPTPQEGWKQGGGAVWWVE